MVENLHKYECFKNCLLYSILHHDSISLWMKANLSIVPKILGLLNLAIEQTRTIDGISDTLEDDVE